jgi:outer membrane protein
MRKTLGWVLILGLLSLGLPAFAQLTPPVTPPVQETPLPPPVVLPSATGAPADVPTTRPLTADEAAALALHYQPTLVGAQGQLLSAQGVTQQVRSALGPQVGTAGSYLASAGGNGGVGGFSGTGGLGSGGSASIGGVPAGWNLSATVRQLLYDFNHTRDLVRQASAQERSAGAALTAAQATLVFQVKQAFYLSLQDERLIDVAQENVKNQQGHLAEAQARLNTGLGLPLDVVRAETAVSDAIFGLTQAQGAASIARTNLALALGVDPRIPLEPADNPETANVGDDVVALGAQALARRPEILVAQEDLNAAQWGLSAARTTDAPVFSGVAGWVDHDTTFPPESSTVGLGVGATWTLFDSGFARGRVKQAGGAVQSAQAQLASTRLAVLGDVDQAWLNLKTAEQHVVTAQAEVINAREGLRLAEGRFRAGIGLFLDVLDAQAALVTALGNQVNSLTAVNQARAALAHAVNADPVLATAPAPAVLK